MLLCFAFFLKGHSQTYVAYTPCSSTCSTIMSLRVPHMNINVHLMSEDFLLEIWPQLLRETPVTCGAKNPTQAGHVRNAQDSSVDASICGLEPANLTSECCHAGTPHYGEGRQLTLQKECPRSLRLLECYIVAWSTAANPRVVEAIDGAEHDLNPCPSSRTALKSRRL